jgi:uncharacterized cupredoxin-like copper-binding protein
MKKTIFTILILLIAAIALSACGTGSSEAKLSVDMKDFTFTPAEVSVPANSEVTLDLSNSGTLEHEWVILNQGEQISAPFNDDDEEKIFWEAELAPGADETFTFTAPSEPGEYTLVCGTAGHFEAGMIGKLTVTEP